MTTDDELYTALREANANGDHEGVTKLSAYIEQRQQGARPAEEPGLVGQQEAFGLPPNSPAPPQGMAGKAKQLLTSAFTRTGGQSQGNMEMLGEVGAGAVGGSVLGAALPGLLQKGGEAVGKIPGAIGRIGKGAETLGSALKMLPLGERTVRGFGGGVAASTADIAGKAFGLAPAETFVATTLLGGVGEATSSLLFKETGTLAKAVLQAAGGDPNTAITTLKGVIKPYKEMNEATARKLQKQYFGDPLPGYKDTLISGDARAALQQQLRDEDPWLQSAFTGQSVMGKVRPGAGTGPIVPGDTTALAPRAFGRPGEPLLGAPAGNMPTPGSPTLQAAMKARQQAQSASVGAEPKPASSYYRERMFSAVTDAIENGKRFSDTPGAQLFFSHIRTLIETKEVPRATGQDLIKVLSTDRSLNADARRRFAKNIDNEIRDFGKLSEKDAATGAKAIREKLAEELRAALRTAHNEYLKSIGQGALETKYRETATREYTAAAQDHIAHFLSGKGTPTEFRASARDLMKDPASAKFLQKSLAQHLAQAEPTKIAAEFSRVRDSLIDANLMTYEEAAIFRKQTEDVNRVADAGQRLGYQKRLQSMLLNGLARKLVGEAGAAIGR